MKLYFGSVTNTATTWMILSLMGFIGYSVWNQDAIHYWGRRTLFLLAYGLLICCFAAARDGFDKTVQAAIDGSCAPGLFSLVSIPAITGMWGQQRFWLRQLRQYLPDLSICVSSGSM